MCFVVGCLIWWWFCSLGVYFGGLGGGVAEDSAVVCLRFFLGLF